MQHCYTKLFFFSLIVGINTSISIIKCDTAIKFENHNPAVVEILPDAPSDFSQLLNGSQPTTVRLNILLHGTYEIANALRNPFKVYYDQDLMDSAHEIAVRELSRKQLKGFDHVMIYHEGMFRINPEASDAETQFDGMVILPALKNLKMMQDHCNAEQNKQKIIDFYYVFGWSGMLSQGVRRLAALALYNALTVEKDALNDFLQQLPHQPTIKVNIVAHSHGGNVALNLAWFDLAKNLTPIYNAFDVCKENKTLENIYPKWKSLGTELTTEKMQARITDKKYNMDKWLFKPTIKETNNQPLVDNLLMFGTPIQPETYPLIWQSTFGQVINVYSESDTIQNGDNFSTWQRKSFRTVPAENLTKMHDYLAANKKPANLKQIKMILAAKKETSATLNPEQQQMVEAEKLVEQSLGELLYSQSLLLSSFGPSHLEYWVIFWTGYSERLCIRPLPVAVFTPFFLLPSLKNADSVYFDLNSQGDLLFNLAENSETMSPKVIIATLPQQLLKESKRDFFKHKYILKAETTEQVKGLMAQVGGWLERFLLTS